MLLTKMATERIKDFSIEKGVISKQERNRVLQNEVNIKNETRPMQIDDDSLPPPDTGACSTSYTTADCNIENIV